MPHVMLTGQKDQLSREEAIERYILLRLRTEDIRRLGFLLEGLHDGSIQLPAGALHGYPDLTDTVRVAYWGWFASLTDKDSRAVYAFDPLLSLFPNHRPQIIKVQHECEACHPALQQFRNNVAFHNRAAVSAHIAARKRLQDADTSMELTFARKDFLRLMADLATVELTAIPELSQRLAELKVVHHSAFANIRSATSTAASS